MAMLVHVDGCIFYYSWAVNFLIVIVMFTIIISYDSVSSACNVML